MSAQVVQLEPSAHQAVQELLPWYVNGSLGEAEEATVAAHVELCTACQEEIRWHEALREAHAVEPARSDSRAGFALLRERLEPVASQSLWGRVQRAVRAVGLRQHGWAGLSIAALGTLSVALAVALVVSPGRTGEFHGLGRAPLGNPGLARLVVQFAPETTESEMRRILRLSQTRLVDGPTGTDAYLLAVDPAAEREALRVLRSQKAVVLVESLDLREQP